VSVSVNALLLDLTLRAVGFVLFVLFALRNRRTLDGEGDGSGRDRRDNGIDRGRRRLRLVLSGSLGSNGIFDRQFGFAFFDDELSPSVCLGERSRSLVPRRTHPSRSSRMSRVFVDLTSSISRACEMSSLTARVSTASTTRTMSSSPGDLPDEVHLLPVDHPLADGGGVDVHLHRNLDHRLHVASAGRDGEPLDDTLLSVMRSTRLRTVPSEVPTWSAISV